MRGSDKIKSSGFDIRPYRRLPKVALFVVLVVHAALLNGQTPIVAYNFNGYLGDEALAIPSTLNANLNGATPLLVRSPTLVGSAALPLVTPSKFSVFDVTTAGFPDPNGYVEFTITPNFGYQFTVDSIRMLLRRSTGGGVDLLGGPLNLVVRNSLDNFVTNIDGVRDLDDAEGSNLQTVSFAVAQLNSSFPVTYRIYFYNAEEDNQAVSFGHTGAANAPKLLVFGDVSISPLPTVITGTPLVANPFLAVSGGNITNQGGAAVTERGVLWSTVPNPTLAQAPNGTAISVPPGIGVFHAPMAALKPGRTYYARAWASNPFGTGYGLSVPFTTASLPTTSLAYWNFGNTPATFTTSATVENMPGAPQILFGGGLTDIDGKEGIAYTSVLGTSYSRGQALAWDDVNNGGPDAFFLLEFDATGRQEFGLKFDYMLQSPGDFFTLDFSLDGGITYTPWSTPVLNHTKINADYNWSTAYISLVGLGAINNQPNVRLRIRSTVANGGDGEMRIDNVELLGNIFCTTPANPPNLISGTSPACDSMTLTYTGTIPGGVMYYWQNAAGSFDSSRPATSPYTTSLSGLYYVRGKSIIGNCWSAGSAGPFSLTVNGGVNITGQPSNRSAIVPNPVSFSVSASGTGIGYQWQQNSGGVWSNLTNTGIFSGVNTPTLQLSSTSLGLNNSVFRCILTVPGPCSSDTTSSAILTISNPPCVDQPFVDGNVTVPPGWTFTGMAQYTSAALSGRAPNSLNFNTTNDQVITELLATPAAQLSFWCRMNGADLLSSLLIEGWNGSAWVTVHNRSGITNAAGGETFTYNPTSTPALPAGLTRFRFTYTKVANNLAFDDVIIFCGLPPCAPAPTITGMFPSTGPVGTWVTLTGTGFTGASVVGFGSVNTTDFEVLSSTRLVVRVPEGAGTGKISLISGPGNCRGESVGNFTTILPTNCAEGGVGSDLIISEVFHSQVGSQMAGYIEVFNGTTGPINLSNYSLRIVEGGTITTNISLGPGTLPSGSTFLVRVGLLSAPCAITADVVNPAARFLGDDQIYLLKSGAVLDYVPNPNHPDASGPGGNLSGWTQRRTSEYWDPSDTYIFSDWEIDNNETCNHLGIGSFTVSGSNITITAQPSSVDCAPITFSVNAVGSGPLAGTVVYLWKYLNPATGNWENASSISLPGVTTANTNTATMTISGPTAELYNYQFYCQMTRLGCVSVTKTVRFTYNSRPFYRTVSGGNYTSVGIWEMSWDEVNWVPASCQYPIAINSSKITIRPGHVVNLSTLTLNADWVIIKPGGQLTLASDARLILNDSATGADLVVNGTLLDAASSGNGLSFNTGASWAMGASGTLIKTNNSSTTVYRDRYEGGISTIPTTANWVYRYTGPGTTPATIATNMFYPNLSFESTSGPYSFNNSLTALTGGSGGFATVKGDLNIGTSGISTVSVYNNNINTNPMLLLGNLNIGNGSLLTNQSYDGTTDGSTRGFGTGFDLRGQLNIAGSGQWAVVFNAMNPNSGTLVLAGTVPQILTGAAGSTLSVAHLTVNNAAGVQVNLPTAVTGTLTFQNGVITTNATNKLVFGPGATHTGSAPGRYINGPASKQFNAAGTAFTFPVGKPGSGLRPVRFTPSTASASTFEAEYFGAAPPVSGNDFFAGTMQGILNQEYWRIDRTSGSTPGRVTLSYINPGAGNWRTMLGNPISPCVTCNVAVARRTTAAGFGTWEFTKPSFTFDVFGSPPEAMKADTASGDVISGEVSTFSPFTIGFDFNTILGVLPVKLLQFDANRQQDDVVVSWKIESSADLAFFEVEHSVNGRQFDVLERVNSGELLYHYRHVKPGSGAHYYRIRVHEKTGQSYYSPVRTVNLAKGGSYIVGLQPGPSMQELSVRLWLAKPQRIELMVSDISGRILSRKATQQLQGAATVSIQIPPFAGVYHISVVSEDGIYQTLRWQRQP